MPCFLFSLGANNHVIAEKNKEEEKHENMKKLNLESYFLSQLIEEHMVRKFTHSANLLLYEFKISDSAHIFF